MFLAYPCCCEEEPPTVECTHCEDDEGPEEFQVVISGLTNSGGCANCGSLNGTYTLTYIGGCSWRYILPSTICTFFGIGVNITATYIEVTVSSTVVSQTFRLDITAPYNCLDIAELDVPLFFDAGPFGGCNGGTATVTAL
jgi:hypothetical protein